MKLIHKYRKLLVALLIVAAVLAALPFARHFSLDGLLNYTPASPLLAALVLIGIYCLKTVVMVIPTYGLYMAAGLLLPTGWAFVVGYVGLALELTLGFFTGRWLGGDKVRQLALRNAKTARVLQFVDGNSLFVCFLTRVLPMPYPIDVGSMLFGAAGLAYGPYLLASLLGMSAVMIPFTLAGGHLDDPLSAQFLVPFGISIGISAALMVAHRIWSKRKEKAQAEQVAPEVEAGPEAETAPTALAAEEETQG